MVPLACAAVGILVMLGYWEIYDAVRPSRGGDAAHGRAIAYLVSLVFALISGLVLGAGVGFWGYWRARPFVRTLVTGVAVVVGLLTVLLVPSFVTG